MKTKILIMRPGAAEEFGTVDLPSMPAFDQLEKVIKPFLDGGNLEHVTVLAAFHGGTELKTADMFVDERGHAKGLARNEAATITYQRNTMLRNPTTDPSTLPWIAGTAILFERRVWF